MTRRTQVNVDTWYVAPYVTGWCDVEWNEVRPPAKDDSCDQGDSEGTLTGYGVALNDTTHSEYGSNSFTLEDLGFIPRSGEAVAIVIERYSSGSTFGHQDGNHRVMKIFKTLEEANAWTNTPEAEDRKDRDYFGGHQNWVVEAVEVTGEDFDFAETVWCECGKLGALHYGHGNLLISRLKNAWFLSKGYKQEEIIVSTKDIGELLAHIPDEQLEEATSAAMTVIKR